MPATRQLAAVMFTDLVGYTALMQQNEQLAVQKRERNKSIFEEAIQKFDGKILQYYGDGTLSIFTSALNAINSAIEMQTCSLREAIDLRIGIHIGEVMIDDNGIYGDSVNVASRIESLATPGSIFISEKLYDDIKNREEFSTVALGYFELKNVKQPVHVYAISNNGIIVPSREDVRGKVKQTLNSIAVLPFASLSTDAENETFCDGITEELINALAQVEGLQVTSRTSSFAFKGKNEDIREIAARLSVLKVIEGSVRKAGSKVRITAQLINAADGYHIWSAVYDRQLDDIFDVQDEISKTIANKLRENLNTEQHESPLAVAPTKSLDAWKKYLQGAYNWDSANRAVSKAAIAALEEAVELDAGFANAHALLSNIYSFAGLVEDMDIETAKQKFKFHAAQAFASQPLNPKSLAAMANVHMHAFDWQGAYDLLMKANAINGSEPYVLFMLGEYYLLMLEIEKAANVARLMAEVDPLNPRTLSEAARIYMSIGKSDEAIAVADRALQLQPANFLAKQMKGYSLFSKGDIVTGTRLIEENQQIAGDHPFVLLGLAYCYIGTGNQEKLKAIEEKIQRYSETQHTPDLLLLFNLLRVMKGERDGYASYIDKAFEMKSFPAMQLYCAEVSKNMWHDEHVCAVRKKAGLPVYA